MRTFSSLSACTIWKAGFFLIGHAERSGVSNTRESINPAERSSWRGRREETKVSAKLNAHTGSQTRGTHREKGGEGRGREGGSGSIGCRRESWKVWWEPKMLCTVREEAIAAARAACLPACAGWIVPLKRQARRRSEHVCRWRETSCRPERSGIVDSQLMQGGWAVSWVGVEEEEEGRRR